MLTLDTSAIVAAADRSDRWHGEAVSLLSSGEAPFLIPTGILAEVAYMLELRLGASALSPFLQALLRSPIELVPTEQDIERIEQLTKRYASLPLGFADAAVVACAERNGGRVMTFDADFQVVAKAGAISVAP